MTCNRTFHQRKQSAEPTGTSPSEGSSVVRRVPRSSGTPIVFHPYPEYCHHRGPPVSDFGAPGPSGAAFSILTKTAGPLPILAISSRSVNSAPTTSSSCERDTLPTILAVSISSSPPRFSSDGDIGGTTTDVNAGV